MYVVADDFESGESLIQWHWQVFDDDVLDEDVQADLLEDIANSGHVLGALGRNILQFTKAA